MTVNSSLQLKNVRLPAWLLPSNWAHDQGVPITANILIKNGLFDEIVPSHLDSRDSGSSDLDAIDSDKVCDLQGRLVLPSLMDAHTHLDKTFTRHRLGTPEPGLLAAIEAMKKDQSLWNKDDLIQRTDRALLEASNHGVSLLRSHVDWHSDEAPFAWQVLGEQTHNWHNKIRLQRVALVPLPFLSSDTQADNIGKQIKASDDAILGGFIHSSNFNAEAIARLVHTAIKFELDLDLHLDEELNPQAKGLGCLLDILETVQFTGRIICSHVCALSQKDDDEASKLLDRIAKQPITLIALPATNLLLQDAVTNITPRQRGLTLVHEAKARGIPVLFANDNVQDAFCPFGVYDPVDALRLGAYSAQLDRVFDEWSQSICRHDWLDSSSPEFTLIGQAADLTVFNTTSAASWPSNETRLLLKNGQWIEAAQPLSSEHFLVKTPSGDTL
ncbi:MAG: hypothetical protein ABJN96_12810 [Marinomonas sp.]